MLLLMLEDGEVADRFETSIKSFDAIKEHLKKYWITSPVDGVDLKLDIIGEESVTADNDVTDHYVESNEAYQDQITIKPTIYTINGEVGELVWYQKDTVSQRVGQVAQRLEGVVSFLPIRSRSFQQMKKKVMQAAQWVDTASNILDRFDTLTPGMTNQAQAFYWLMSWRNFRRPLTVVSPWGKLVNFVITNLRITQPRDTKDKSLISITFKEFRTTSVTTVDFEEDKFQGVAKQENQPKVDNGKTDGTDASIETYDYEMADGTKGKACDVPNTENAVVYFDDGLGFNVVNKETGYFYPSESEEFKIGVDYGMNKCKIGVEEIK